ncbi:glycosyltransferase family 4 protein [soil metagenome]
MPAVSAPRLTIGLARRGHSDTGGAEAYLKRLARGLSESGHTTRLFTDAAWPPREWTWGPITRLRGETAHRFADELEKIKPREHCDLLLSLERVWQCNVYRAGDGIHRAWLQRRNAAAPLFRRWLRRFNSKHQEIIELEEALFSGGAHRVIANSHMVRGEAIQFYGYPADQIEVIPNGIPLTDFRPDPAARAARRKSLRLREDEIAVLFVGSGWERKGLRYAIKAVNSLGANFRLLVAGEGRAHKVTGRSVQRLGPVRDLPALYAAADIFLLPTLYDPFSNACLEALAAGLPVVTTAHNGFSEIITTGVHGSVLASSTDTAEIREALLYWSDAERRAAARPALLECAGKFDISVNVERTLEVLNHALNAEAVSGKIRKT